MPVDPYAATNAFRSTLGTLSDLRQRDIDNNRNQLRDMYLGKQEQRAQAQDARIAQQDQVAQEERARELLTNVYAPLARQALESGNPSQFIANQLRNPAVYQMFKRDGIFDPDKIPLNDPSLAQSLEGIASFAGAGNNQTRVQSAQILDNGNIGYLTTDGRLVDTGQKGKPQLQLTDIAGAPSIVDLRAARTTQLSSPEQERAAAANQAGAVAAAQEGARTAAIPERAAAEMAVDEQKLRATNERAYASYSAAMGNVAKSLGQTSTGPVYGILPALTANQQISDAALAAMAPVLKQLFRSAGEGVFTDRDQQLLLDMLPNRSVHPAARGPIIKAIDDIVKAKLGISSAQNAPAKNAKGWDLMIDANGNRAYVGPNGEIEEVQ